MLKLKTLYRFCKKIVISVLKRTKNEYRNISISILTTHIGQYQAERVLSGLGIC